MGRWCAPPELFRLAIPHSSPLRGGIRRYDHSLPHRCCSVCEVVHTGKIFRQKIIVDPDG